MPLELENARKGDYNYRTKIGRKNYRQISTGKSKRFTVIINMLNPTNDSSIQNKAGHRCDIFRIDSLPIFISTIITKQILSGISELLYRSHHLKIATGKQTSNRRLTFTSRMSYSSRRTLKMAIVHGFGGLKTTLSIEPRIKRVTKGTT